jgi:hypothetical protein
MYRAFTLLAGMFAASTAAIADIEKIAIPGERGLQFYWWPKVPLVEGWRHDREHSLHYSVNALAPNGFTLPMPNL